MTGTFALPVVALGRIRDVIDLGKPRITLLVVFTAAVGLWLAPANPGPARGAIFLLATALLVGSANTLNCFLERETDGRMVRTRNRPLPAGRLDPGTALALGIGLGAFAIPLLSFAANPLTALLGAIAHTSYVWIYTPLKRLTPHALEIGALPGAIPPLMGWTAATGELSAPGWVLFGILFFWQLPHFVSISLYLEEDYRRGGLPVLPVVRGRSVAKRYLLVYTAGLAVFGVVVATGDMTGRLYLGTAVALGTIFVLLAARGLRRRAGAAWARNTFVYSLVYLTVLITVLVLDAR